MLNIILKNSKKKRNRRPTIQSNKEQNMFASLVQFVYLYLGTNGAQLIVSRTFYEMMKILVQNHQSSRTKIEFYISLFCFVYSHRLMLISYVMYTDYTFTLEWFNFMEQDIVLGYLHQNSHLYEPFLFFCFYFFNLFLSYCQYSLYYLNSDTTTWRWWYQLVVVNQDRSYKSLLSTEMVKKSRMQQVKSLMRHLIASKNPFVLCLLLVIPYTVLKYGCTFWVQLNSWYHMNNINRKQLFHKPMNKMPNLSIKTRKKVLHWLILADLLAYLFQWIIGELLFIYDDDGDDYKIIKQFFVIFSSFGFILFI